MLESMLRRILARVDSVTRPVPPSEIRRSARRGGSQLEACGALLLCQRRAPEGAQCYF